MRLLIVLSHPDTRSFNASLSRAASDAATEAGHQVRVSDLYAQGFNPVLDRETFRQHHPGVFPGANLPLPTDVQAEIEKVFWCDALVLQFPLWCFGVPAMLKGWLDRVIVTHPVSGGGRFFHKGVFSGKRAMCSLSTGGAETEYSPWGLHGDIGQILRPVQHGIFAATGFQVVEPFIAWAVVKRNREERAALIEEGVRRMLNIGHGPFVSYPPLDAYDETLQLKQRPGKESPS